MTNHLLAFYRCSVAAGTRLAARSSSSSSVRPSPSASALQPSPPSLQQVLLLKSPCAPGEQWRSPAPLTDGAERLRCGVSPLGFEPRSLRLGTAVGLTRRRVTNRIESLFGGYASAFPRTLDYPAKVGFCTSVITPFRI